MDATARVHHGSRKCGGVAAWPLMTRAKQPSDQTRRIGVLMNRAAHDSEGQARMAVFQQALQQLAWSERQNVRIDIRWGEDDIDHERKYAAELVALAPEVVLASGTLSEAALQRINRWPGLRRSGWVWKPQWPD
jgi:putative ABC transport system substrate-binding protein